MVDMERIPYLRIENGRIHYGQESDGYLRGPCDFYALGLIDKRRGEAVARAADGIWRLRWHPGSFEETASLERLTDG